MTDIVERLRIGDKVLRNMATQRTDGKLDDCLEASLMREAADTIEELRQQLWPLKQ